MLSVPGDSFAPGEAPLGGLLMAPGRVGAGHQEDAAWIEAESFQRLISPDTSLGGRGLDMESVTIRLWVREEASIKIPTAWGLDSFQLNTATHRRETHLDSAGTEAPVLGPLPHCALCTSSSGCSLFLHTLPQGL